MTFHELTGIAGLRTVAVPVSNQAEALTFYVEILGFPVRMDVQAGPMRWIEVAPPQSEASVALVEATGERPAGTDTGIRFGTHDADACHKGLVERGVEVDEILRWPGVPAMFVFRDLDANAFVIVEA